MIMRKSKAAVATTKPVVVDSMAARKESKENYHQQ
jgi:hypothetical protein